MDESKNEEKNLKENMGLIWYVAHKYEGLGVEKGELFQLAAIGYIKALRRFKKDRKCCISTYAIPLMRGEILKHIEKEEKIRKQKERYSRLQCPKIEEQDPIAELLDRVEMEQKLALLGQAEQKLISLRYWKHLTQKETGERMGLSQTQVCRMEKKVLGEMKKLW